MARRGSVGCAEGLVWSDSSRAHTLCRAVILRLVILSACWPIASPLIANAQTTATTSGPTLEIYGFVEGDAIVDFGRNNPDWYDANRPSKLPAFANEFGQNGHFYLSPRQTRFGVNSDFPSGAGDVHATFEFDMVGTGADAGQTTIRLRHAWGQWKQVGAGQTYSEFMDPDIYPNRLDVWGPNGMLTSRTPQVFWEPYLLDGGSNLRIAIENPRASADGGIFADRIELQHVIARFPMPDLTGHYRRAGPWGYLQAGGVFSYEAWDDTLQNPFNLSGHVWAWGTSLSSNITAWSGNILRLQTVYGHGVEKYFNDAPIDVGVELNLSNRVMPITGQALPVLGITAYLDHTLDGHWSASTGYSRLDIRNSNGEAPSAFRLGQYATATLRYAPDPHVLIGAEFQWAQRRNFSDGWIVNDYRLECSFRYIYSHKVAN
jgi:outer membrane DcaP-like protein